MPTVELVSSYNSNSSAYLAEFIPTQNADIVINVKMIIINPNMNPTLNVSILRTQDKGEKRARTISPKYSCFKSSN